MNLPLTDIHSACVREDIVGGLFTFKELTVIAEALGSTLASETTLYGMQQAQLMLISNSEKESLRQNLARLEESINLDKSILEHIVDMLTDHWADLSMPRKAIEGEYHVGEL